MEQYEPQILNNLTIFVDGLLRAYGSAQRRCDAALVLIKRAIVRHEDPAKRIADLAGTQPALGKVLRLIAQPSVDLLALMRGSRPTTSAAAGVTIVHRAACGVALYSAWSKEERYLLFFTTDMLGRPQAAAPYVAEVLMAGRWIDRKEPLRAVEKQVRDLMRVLSKDGAIGRTDAMRDAQPLTAAMSDPVGVAFGGDLFAALCTKYDLKKILRRAKLREFAQELAQAQYHLASVYPREYPHQELADYLADVTGRHVTIQQVDAAQKELQRAEDRLRREAAPYLRGRRASGRAKKHTPKGAGKTRRNQNS